jgi:Uri superfamily endonuclease
VKGIYVLLIQLSRDANVTVGKLGTLHFIEGLYAYVGSAQGALEKRVQRHLRREKQVFWHIDYLLQNPNAKILKVFTLPAGRKEECSTAKRIAANGRIAVGFGCSDCHCQSHLIQIDDCNFLNRSMQEYALPNPSTTS